LDQGELVIPGILEFVISIIVGWVIASMVRFVISIVVGFVIPSIVEGSLLLRSCRGAR
jgi:hypothetical protein